MPATTVNVVGLGETGRLPVLVVETARERARALHEIGRVSGVPRTFRVTVGWLGSELHCSTMPREEGSNPDPVIVTTVPPLRHVPGITVIVAEPLLAVEGSALHPVDWLITTLGEGWIVADFRRQDFHGHQPVQFPLPGLVNHAHAAAAK